MGLAAAYSVATPILEAGDESAHHAAVAWIAAGRGLPVLNPADRDRLLSPGQEAGQPPLYYLLASAATAWIRAPDPMSVVVANPHSDIGHPDTSGWNKNFVVHANGDDGFPWTGLALAVHVGRLLSITAGGVAIVVVYRLVRLALPGEPAAAPLAAAFVAFNPMLLFVSASVSNDALAFALASAVLLLLTDALRRGATRRGAATTGVLLGLTLLTKLNAAGVIVPAAIVYLWLAAKQRSVCRAAEYLALLAVPASGLAGWWLVRNWVLYGDLTALNAFAILDPSRRSAPIGLNEVLRELPGAWIAFWGVFGVFDIMLLPSYYTTVNVLTLAAGLGLLVALAGWLRRGAGVDPVLVLLVGWLALESALLVGWTIETSASTGRLLFPAIGSIAYLYARGLTALGGRLVALWAGLAATILACGAALAIPLAILPAYVPPAFVPPDELRPDVTLGYRYDGLELVGATLEPGPVSPGATTRVQLFWRAPGPVVRDYVVSVQLRESDGFLVGQTDVLPGNGKALTSRWPPDQGLVDVVPVVIRDESPSPSLAHVSVYTYPLGQMPQPVSVVDPSGKELNVPDIAELEVRDPFSPAVTPATTPLGVFGDAILLVDAANPARAAIGGSLNVELRWQALRRPTADYTVFLHAIAPDGRLAFQLDSPPRGGGLPTRDWVPGQMVEDTMAVAVPGRALSGQYRLTIGLYQLETGARLRLADGTSELPLGSVEIAPAPG